MRRIAFLLILLAALAFNAFPAVAEQVGDTWRIAVFASNAETRVVSGGHYCLMPGSMPIRPGNHAVLRDAENDTLVTTKFYDPVEDTPDPEFDTPGEGCELMALFPPVAPRDGLRIVIKPYPPPAEHVPSLRVTINVSVIVPAPFDWWYDDRGYKRCRPLGDIRFGHDSPVVTTPASRLSLAGQLSKPRFIANVIYSDLQGEDVCHILTSLEFPIADEYIIEFGGAAQDEDAD